MADIGAEAVVRFRNNGNKEIAVHVHGQYNRAPFDGWASDLAKPGEYKDYYYPNSQNSRTIWYHDHAAWTTADGAYFGQAAFYLLTDPEDEKLGLPSGDYDIGMALESKMYNHDGTLRFETNNNTGLWGDVIQVNGQPWPYVTVEPRKYRIRLLNGAISRGRWGSFIEDHGHQLTALQLSNSRLRQTRATARRSRSTLSVQTAVFLHIPSRVTASQCQWASDMTS